MRNGRFLVAVLWLSALSLLAACFFDVAFGFNLLARAHWRYLSELQVSGRVDPWFYGALGILLASGLAGLYMLVVPWHRRIGRHAVAAGRSQARARHDDFARPPSLNLTNVFVPAARPPEARRAAAPDAPGAAASRRISDMIAGCGFAVRPAPNIGGVRPDFWAVGSGEILLMGKMFHSDADIVAAEGAGSKWRGGPVESDSPVWEMAGASRKLSALFSQVLDPQLKIRIEPFVLADAKISNKDSERRIWDALGIKVFDAMNDFAEFLAAARPPAADDNFEAFDDFMKTAAAHFDGGA